MKQKEIKIQIFNGEKSFYLQMQEKSHQIANFHGIHRIIYAVHISDRFSAAQTIIHRDLIEIFKLFRERTLAYFGRGRLLISPCEIDSNLYF